MTRRRRYSQSLRSIRIADVAARAGVSAQTVSRAFTGRGRISPITVDRVLAVARDLGYVPNALARSLASERTTTLGVVIPGLGNYFSSQVIAAVDRTAGEFGYALVMTSGKEIDAGASPLSDPLLHQRVGGVIVIRPRTPAYAVYARRIHEGGTPVVIAGPYQSKPEGVSVVNIDQVVAGSLAGSHFVSRGHHRIGAISGPADWEVCAENTRGLRTAIQAAGGTLDQDALEPASEWSIPGGVDAAARLLDRRPDLTALFCHSDDLAIGAITAARRLGLVVPEDLSVIGVGDREIAPYQSPPLTTVPQPREQIGNLAVALLFEMINDHERRPRGDIVLDPVLVERESVTAPRR